MIQKIITDFPDGVALSDSPSTVERSASVGSYTHFGFRLTGIAEKINISINFSGVNTTYDSTTAVITVTYA